MEAALAEAADLRRDHLDRVVAQLATQVQLERHNKSIWAGIFDDHAQTTTGAAAWDAPGTSDPSESEVLTDAVTWAATG